MKKNEPLNETTIKYALQEGLITAKEARNMLRVYLYKSNFSPRRNPAIKTHQVV